MLFTEKLFGILHLSTMSLVVIGQEVYYISSKVLFFHLILPFYNDNMHVEACLPIWA